MKFIIIMKNMNGEKNKHILDINYWWSIRMRKMFLDFHTVRPCLTQKIVKIAFV